MGYMLQKEERRMGGGNVSQDQRGIIRMCEQVAASGNTLILYSA